MSVYLRGEQRQGTTAGLKTYIRQTQVEETSTRFIQIQKHSQSQ